MGHMDYTIKVLKELICIMEGIQYQIAIGFTQVSNPILFQSFLRPVPLTDLILLVIYRMLYNAKVLSKLIRENERRMMLSVKNMTISSGS